MFGLYSLLLIQTSPYEAKGEECSDDGILYRGCVNQGHNDEECSKWTATDSWGNGFWGDEEFITQDKAQKNGIGDHNYCRNPERLRYGPWCYEKGTHNKIYCAVDVSNCAYIQPENDPNCPRSEITPSQVPVVMVSNIDMGQEMELICKEGCKGVTSWSNKPPRSLVTEDGTLTVDAVDDDTSGSWDCSCDGEHFTHKIEVCVIIESQCRKYGDKWFKELTSRCTPDESPNRVPCSPDPKSDNSGEAQASNSEPGCTGSDCGLCTRNPILCGILTFGVTTLVVVGVVFVWKSMKWRKVAKQAQSEAALSAGNIALGTLRSLQSHQSRLPGSSLYMTHEPPTQHYELQQYLNSGGGMVADMSRATSITDISHLRELRKPGGMGRIQTDEVIASQDNIACERREFDDATVSQWEGEQGTMSTMGFTARKMARNFKEEEFGPRDATLFDKYYDEHVERWSMQNEIQI